MKTFDAPAELVKIEFRFFNREVIMQTKSIIYGVLMIVIGAVGVYIASVDGKPSVTAGIPAIFGAVIVIATMIGRAAEPMRRHTMHLSLTIALIGIIAVVYRWVSAGTFSSGSASLSPALTIQAAFVISCAGLLVAGIRSFIAARSGK